MNLLKIKVFILAKILQTVLHFYHRFEGLFYIELQILSGEKLFDIRFKVSLLKPKMYTGVKHKRIIN